MNQSRITQILEATVYLGNLLYENIEAARSRSSRELQDAADRLTVEVLRELLTASRLSDTNGCPFCSNPNTTL